MAKLKIVKMGDPVLRKVCRPVDKITPRILTLIDDMVDTMRAANGAGLAAPQVGVLRRIVVIETEEGKVPVLATITGIIRGLIRDGYPVTVGFKIADIDPRREELENCWLISDKARCIAGSVLEQVCAAVLK